MAVDHNKKDMDIDNKGSVAFVQRYAHFLHKGFDLCSPIQTFLWFSWLKKVKKSRKVNQ